MDIKQYCTGKGLDLGCGENKLEGAWGLDLPVPYAKVNDLIELRGDARNLSFINDDVLDYVYSSHLLEDFEDTEEVLREWLRIIKIGGYLILILPDEQIYRQWCVANNEQNNPHHTIFNMSLEYMLNVVKKLSVKVIGKENYSDYSFILVAEKC